MLYHGTYLDITYSLIESGRYDVVISDHTHQMVERRVDETLHLNPGTADGLEGKIIAYLNAENKTVELN